MVFSRETEAGFVDRKSLNSTCMASQDGRVVSGVDVDQVARCGIVFGDECGGEPASILAVAAGVLIHTIYQID